MPDEPSWPKPDTNLAEGDKLLFQAKLDYLKELAKSEQAKELEVLKSKEALELAETQAELALEKAEQEADAASTKATTDAINTSVAAFHAALIEVSKTAIDRARAGADTVQKAAGAIGTVYTTLLALAFSVAERPLPSRGLVPAILLGWAIVWSTAYLAYLSKSKQVKKPKPTTSFETGAMRRSITFIEWTRSGAMNRKFALRVSVFGLAFGLALLPAPFVNFDPVNESTPALPSAPDWPAQPIGGDKELNKIIYQAEVTEVAELRASDEPIADDGDDSTWWILCGIALVASLAIPGCFAAYDKIKGDEADEEENGGDDDNGEDKDGDVIPGPAEATTT